MSRYNSKSDFYYWSSVTAFAALFIILLYGYIRTPSKNSEQKHTDVTVVDNIFSVSFSTCNDSVICELPKPTITSVYRCIIKNEIEHPEIVLRQALLETNYFTCSNCCLSINNLFGFTTNKMLSFDNWQQSIEYYKKWQMKVYTPNKSKYKDYYHFLHVFRFARDTVNNTEKDYVNKLRSIQVCL